MKRILVNPRLRWGVEPEHQRDVKYIEGIAGIAKRVPEVGEVLTLPFLVSPKTGQPMPVRVTRIEYEDLSDHTVVIPVVVPAQPDR